MSKGPRATPVGSGQGPQRPPPRSASRRKRERRRTAAAQGPVGRGPVWRQRRLWNAVAAAGAAAAVIALVVALRSAGGSSNTAASTSATPRPSPTATPLAALSSGGTGQAIDGIQCQATESLYHIHAHLAIYVNGVKRGVPEGLGIAPPRHVVQSDAGPLVESGKCSYWLLTHTDDGIIHVEAPTQTAYTLGQFFAVWGQPLAADQIGPASGTLIVYVNGQRYTGDPQQITLTPHELIQLDVGTDVPPQPFTFPPGY